MNESPTNPRPLLADASDRGLLLVGGKDRVSLLQRITSNDLKKLAPGHGSVGCFTNAKGRIVDRCRFLADADAMLVSTHPGRAAPVAAWIDRYVITEDVKVRDLSASIAQFHLLGPIARTIATAIDPRSATLQRYDHLTTSFSGVEPLTIVATEGLGDAPGFLVLGPRDQRDALLAALIAATTLAAKAPLHLLTPDEYETLRIEAGVPRYGVDYGEENNPLECGFWDSVSFEKGCYVGQEVVARLRNYDKVMKQLCTLDFVHADERVTPGALLFGEEREVGKLTSVSRREDGSCRALGWVNRRVVQGGAEISVASLDSTSRAKPLPLRFD